MDSTPHCSRVVPHPSTERAQTALTSVFGWEPVHYGWYGRIRSNKFTCSSCLCTFECLMWDWCSKPQMGNLVQQTHTHCILWHPDTQMGGLDTWTHTKCILLCKWGGLVLEEKRWVDYVNGDRMLSFCSVWGPCLSVKALPPFTESPQRTLSKRHPPPFAYTGSELKNSLK